MRPGRIRLISLLVAAAQACSLIAAGLHDAAAAERPLSAAQIGKITGWIAEQGRTVAISPMVTDIVGLTNADQTISSRAFAAVDDRNGEIHQIYMLPDARGYLMDHFHQDKVEIFWTDNAFALVASLSGVRGEKPAPTSSVEAQSEFADELAWWARFADTH